MRSSYDALRRSVREFFLLETQERAARSISPERQNAARSLLNAAGGRWSVADDLLDPPEVVAALVLYGEAVDLLIAAIILTYGDELSSHDVDAVPIAPALEKLVEAGKIDPPPVVFEAMRFIANRDRMKIDAMGPDVQARTRESMAAAAHWLRLRVELRTVPEVRRARVVRLAIAAAVILLLVWLVAQTFRQANLALHRPVQASSRAPQSVAPEDGSGLVNGVKESNYGIHTNVEESPWVMVDLLNSYAISEIEVYNRRDGWFDEGLPLVLELSENGKDFIEVARRTEPFSQALPWVYEGARVRGRYVRVRGLHSSYVALSEIEVYGRL